MLTELGSVMSFAADSAPAFNRVSVGTSRPDFPKLGIIHHILNLYILMNLHPLQNPTQSSSPSPYKAEAAAKQDYKRNNYTIPYIGLHGVDNTSFDSCK